MEDAAQEDTSAGLGVAGRAQAPLEDKVAGPGEDRVQEQAEEAGRGPCTAAADRTSFLS